MSRSRRPRVAALVWTLLFAACVTGPPSVPSPHAPRADPSIRSIEDAIVNYKSERYSEAAWGFAEIVNGRIPGDRQQAAFWLAKSFIKLGDYERAIALFSAIAGDHRHPFYELTLPWLAHLRVRHPGDPRIDWAIGGYPLSILEREELVEVVDDLRVAFAAHRLRIGDVNAAWSLAAGVPTGAGAHREAQLLAGLAADRLGRRAEAVARLEVAAAPVEHRRRNEKKWTELERIDEAIRARAITELRRRGVFSPER